MKKIPTLAKQLLLPAIIACGVFIRLVPFPNYRKPGGGFYFYNPDSYDHLRHIMLYIRQFPSIELHDTYVGYPVGTGHIWSPLYDYIFAAVAKCLNLGMPGIEALCFFSSPVLYAASVILLFFVARRLFGNFPAAVAAAAVFAFHPTLVSYTVTMNFDHHVIEPILLLLFIALPFLEKEGNHRHLRLAAAAILFPAALLLWRGSTLFWGLAFASVLVRVIIREKRLLAAYYAKIFLIASLLLIPICLLTFSGTDPGASLVVISWVPPPDPCLLRYGPLMLRPGASSAPTMENDAGAYTNNPLGRGALRSIVAFQEDLGSRIFLVWDQRYMAQVDQ